MTRAITRRAALITLTSAALAQPFAACAETLPARILILANRERARAGLPTLTPEPRLTRAAQGLADAMIRTGQMSHGADGQTLGRRAERQGYRYRRLGENIAWVTAANPGDLAERFVTMWMQSPPHRANLLDARVTQTGIAIASAGADTAAAQIFGLPQ